MNRKNSGVSLIGAIVALVAIVIGVLAISSLSNSLNMSEKRLDRKVEAEQVLALTARSFSDKDFNEVVEICNTANKSGKKPIDAPPPAVGKCRGDDGKFNKDAVLNSPPGANPLFEIHVNNKAEPDNNGDYCVELSQCVFKASNHILDIGITAFYPSPDQNLAALSSTMTFRRTRW